MNISYDRVPKGSAELRHASAILSADGSYLGGVRGFHLDDTGQITGRRPRREPLLEPLRDHDPGRDAVQLLETDTVTVRLSAAEIAELPTTRVRRWF